MTDHLDLWNALSRTDPNHTKRFQRSGGFRGTSVKPIYTTMKMTERFGPCGKGWGMFAPQFQVVPAGEETAVYCTVGLWWENPEQTVYGVGGDFVAKKNKNGLFADDEAFKKAFTDAIGNAMKHLGMAADVHMGQHDDDKYVTELRREIEAEQRTGSSAGSEQRASTSRVAGSSPAPSTKYQMVNPSTGEVVAEYGLAKDFMDALEAEMRDGDPLHWWGTNQATAKRIREEIPLSAPHYQQLEQMVTAVPA